MSQAPLPTGRVGALGIKDTGHPRRLLQHGASRSVSNPIKWQSSLPSSFVSFPLRFGDIHVYNWVGRDSEAKFLVKGDNTTV